MYGYKPGIHLGVVPAMEPVPKRLVTFSGGEVLYRGLLSTRNWR
jgi:hypothetical protein